VTKCFIKGDFFGILLTSGQGEIKKRHGDPQERAETFFAAEVL